MPTDQTVMSLTSRSVLLFSALIWGMSVAFTGARFSRAAEPEPFPIMTLMFWLLFGILVVFPFWLPAIFPFRRAERRRACQILCAVCLFLFLLFSGSLLLQRLKPLFSAPHTNLAMMGKATFLFATCLASLVVLLRPVPPDKPSLR